MEKIIKKKQCILIYPEGHEWPYYTSIRPFKEGAFHYPSKFNCPILPFVQIVKERKIFKNLKPKLEIRFLKPIYTILVLLFFYLSWGKSSYHSDLTGFVK